MKHSDRGGPCPNDGRPGPFWCSLCYSNVRGRSRFRGHRAYRATVRVGPSVFEVSMQKPSAPRPMPEYPMGVSDSAFVKRFPTLLTYLADTKWDDGSARDPSTVSLFLDNGMFKASLNDRDGKRSMYVTGVTLEGVLDVLEANLREDRGEWRSWNAKTKKGK